MNTIGIVDVDAKATLTVFEGTVREQVAAISYVVVCLRVVGELVVGDREQWILVLSFEHFVSRKAVDKLEKEEVFRHERLVFGD